MTDGGEAEEEKELRERWPSADRAAVITEDGELHGFDRRDDGEDGENE